MLSQSCIPGRHPAWSLHIVFFIYCQNFFADTFLGFSYPCSEMRQVCIFLSGIDFVSFCLINNVILASFDELGPLRSFSVSWKSWYKSRIFSSKNFWRRPPSSRYTQIQGFLTFLVNQAFYDYQVTLFIINNVLGFF